MGKTTLNKMTGSSKPQEGIVFVHNTIEGTVNKMKKDLAEGLTKANPDIKIVENNQVKKTSKGRTMIDTDTSN